MEKIVFPLASGGGGGGREGGGNSRLISSLQDFFPFPVPIPEIGMSKMGGYLGS